MDIQLPSTVYWACACSVYTPWYTVPPLSYMHGLFLSPRVCSLGFVLYQHHIILIAITLYFILSVESSPLTLPFSEMSCFFWSFSAYEFYSLLVELYTHTHRYTQMDSEALKTFSWKCVSCETYQNKEVTLTLLTYWGLLCDHKSVGIKLEMWINTAWLGEKKKRKGSCV